MNRYILLFLSLLTISLAQTIIADSKPKIVENEASIVVPLPVGNETLFEENRTEIDLSGVNQETDSDTNGTKIETNDIAGDAPKIASISTPEEDRRIFPLVKAEVPTMEEIDSYIVVDDLPIEDTTTEEPEHYNINDGVVLPTDNDTEVVLNVESTKNTTFEAPPMTFWDHSTRFVQDFTYENPQISLIIIASFVSILLLLVFLVLRQCCKRKRYPYARPTQRFEPITSDLYNTSNCSHNFKPTTLPNQQEVTMQLLSADCSAEV